MMGFMGSSANARETMPGPRVQLPWLIASLTTRPLKFVAIMVFASAVYASARSVPIRKKFSTGNIANAIISLASAKRD